MELDSAFWYFVAFCLLWVTGAIFWLVRRYFHFTLQSGLIRRLRHLFLNRRSWRWIGGWDSITWMDLSLITLLIALNLVMVFDFFQSGIDWKSVERRSAFCATVNIIPLYISKSPLTRSLNFSRSSQKLFHHWVGRIAIAEAITHGSISLANEPRTGSLFTSGSAAFGILISILVFSLFFMRHLLGRLFSLLHRLSSVATAALLLWHVWMVGSIRSRALVGFSCLTWLVSMLSRIHGLLFRRLIGTVVSVERATSLGLIKVDVSLKFLTRIKPGQYFNVFFPGRPVHGHPVAVYWPSLDEGPSRPTGFISFLMSSQASWQGCVDRLKEGDVLLLDGPYGQDLKLHLYENVFLAAQGIGIAGVLPWALELAERKNHDNRIRNEIKHIADAQESLLNEESAAQGDRLEAVREERVELRRKREALRKKPLFLDATQRVVLFWMLEDNLQMEMVKRELKALQKLDPDHRFLVVWCGYPEPRTGRAPFQLSRFWKCFEPSPEGFERKFARQIQEERTKLQGQMIVVACGGPSYTNSMRNSALACSGDLPVAFKETEFRPPSLQYPTATSIASVVSRIRRAKQNQQVDRAGTIELD